MFEYLFPRWVWEFIWGQSATLFMPFLGSIDVYESSHFLRNDINTLSMRKSQAIDMGVRTLH